MNGFLTTSVTAIAGFMSGDSASFTASARAADSRSTSAFLAASDSAPVPASKSLLVAIRRPNTSTTSAAIAASATTGVTVAVRP